MRPVLLEMTGFASFRDPAVVDFTDADYFALVGPTGAGKSTVLDALTFALFGTAPRWGATNAVSEALAPTSNRATVALTFDVGAHRYQIAREVRRSGDHIGHKDVSLIRFPDPTLLRYTDAGDDAEPEVLWAEARGLRDRVEELLGLSYSDFCQCVVLPQGQFQKFLHSSAKDRQNIVLKLLGADEYQRVAQSARAEAATARTRIEMLTGQLGDYADATPESLSLAQARTTALEELESKVDEFLPRLARARRDEAAAAGEATAARADVAVLGDVTAPEGLADAHRGFTDAQQAADEATGQVQAAAADLSATNAAAAEHPPRATLEAAVRHHDEQAELIRRRVRVAETATATAAAVEAAAAALEVTEAGARTAREEVARHQGTRDDLARRVEDAAATTGLLARVRVPDALADLAGRDRAAATRAAAADAGLTQARQTRDQAHEALAVVADDATRARAAELVAELVRIREQLAAETVRLAEQRDREQAATAAVYAATEALAEAEEMLEDARGRAGAAQLRAHLHIGAACPVCDQDVRALPAPLDAGDLQQTRARRDAAQQACEKTAAERHEASSQAALTGQRVESLRAQDEPARRTLRGIVEAIVEPGAEPGVELDVDALPDPTARERLEAMLARLRTERDEAQAALDRAEAASRAAEVEQDAARREREELAGALGLARSELHSLHGALSGLHPPDLPADGDLAEGWRLLGNWAKGRLAQATTERAALEDQLRAADAALGEAQAAQRAAETVAADARTAHADAVGAAATARQELTDLTVRLDDLVKLLADAPAAADLSALLTERDRLDALARSAHETLDRARTAETAAAAALRARREDLDQARRALGAARDRVARLGPPPVDGDDLVGAWQELTSWAGDQSAVRRTAAETAETAAAAARRDASRLDADFDDLLRGHDLDPATFGDGEARVEVLPRRIGTLVERARGERDAVAKDIERAAKLHADRVEAEESRRVADQLDRLLRPDKFPQWLARSALTRLTRGASRTLKELSGGQFSLRYASQEFYVVDHADADSLRPVRTLSGGETFQTSLALALALSEELSGLGGSTRLESIFLDEGFGTLDPDALETVAETLENLSQGSRMVGVITHVAALAERAPVRFRVRRSANASRITREGADGDGVEEVG